jgi:hypothetical protein
MVSRKCGEKLKTRIIQLELEGSPRLLLHTRIYVGILPKEGPHPSSRSAQLSIINVNLGDVLHTNRLSNNTDEISPRFHPFWIAERLNWNGIQRIRVDVGVSSTR